MMSFYSQDLESIMKDLLSRFVRSSVISGVTSVSEWAKLDISKTKNLVSPDKVDIDFANKGATDEVKMSTNISQLQKYKFYQECITFLSKIVEKLNKRSPLKYAVVRALQNPVPRFIALQRENATAKLLDDKWLTSDTRDTIFLQFKRWLQDTDASTIETFESYDMKTDSLDKFYQIHLS